MKPRRRVWGGVAASVLILVAVTACGGGGGAKVRRPAPVDVEEAAGNARDVIEEAYRSLELGSHDGLLSLLAPDVFVAGPGPQVWAERSAALLALADALEAGGGKKHRLKSRALTVAAAPGGHSAWATDQVDFDGQSYLATFVLVDSDGLWVIRAVQLGRPVTAKRAAKLQGDGKLAVLPAVPGGATPASQPVVALVEEATVDRDDLIDQLAERDDVMVIARGATRPTVGVDAVYKAWKKELKKARADAKAKQKQAEKKKAKKKKAKKKGGDDADADDEAGAAAAPPPAEPPAALVRGEPRAALTGDGRLGWVCVNVDVTADRDTPLPERVFYVYLRDGDEWRLVALHEAITAAP
ncbi:MAG: nuclear transport factor 2 family protein [Kofleriaceae bacterium]|nr:nuclear transport factor 2 family protein [Kofleriaceae bacterium]MCB9574702.1 nuclear transport factor 2 family protein [Kofleriaceae bacterium]